VLQRKTNACLRDPIMVRSILSGFIKSFIIISFGYLSFFPSIPSVFKLSLLFDHFPSAYLFSVQLWDILKIFYIFIYYHFCLTIKFPLIPISNLKSSCPQVLCLHQTALLPLFLTSLFFLLSLLHLLTSLGFSFFLLQLRCNFVLAHLSWSCYN